jgi:DtxR family transcriptional regulator, Mn-dependent transcriptional regulator
LVKVLGFGWEEVHYIAEQIEHIHSPEFFEKIDKLLKFPKFDPHGNPIPDKYGKVERKRYDKLSDFKKGDKVRLLAVDSSSDEFLKFLNSHDLKLGLQLTIKSIELFDKSMIVSYSKRNSETLSHAVCERLIVEKQK